MRECAFVFGVLAFRLGATSLPISGSAATHDYRVYRLMYCEHIGDGPCSPRSPGGFAMYSELIALADD
jgi:hypothetical protein